MKNLLFNEEKKLYRSALSQLSWFAGISRPYNSFPLCEASAKFKNLTIKEVPYVNTIINNVESTNYGIKCPHLSMDDLKLQLFTNASFKNLPNGRSKAGQILFLNDDKSRICPFCWNSSKINLSSMFNNSSRNITIKDGRYVSIYINTLLSELLLEHGKMALSHSIIRSPKF